MSSKDKKGGKDKIAETNASIPVGLVYLADAAQVLAAYLQKLDPEEPLRLDEVALQTGLSRGHIEVLIAASALGIRETTRNGSLVLSLDD